jgi:hypothetical protein
MFFGGTNQGKAISFEKDAAVAIKLYCLIMSSLRIVSELKANCQRIVSELKANCQRIVSANKPVFPASRFVPKVFVRKR